MKVTTGPDFISIKINATFYFIKSGVFYIKEGKHSTIYTLTINNGILGFISFIKDKEAEEAFKKFNVMLKSWVHGEEFLENVKRLQLNR